jgi:Family of unknown function (DUF5372)
LPSAVTITRARHPFEGESLPVLGGMRRHGALELLLVLPDGSKSLVPAAWTDVDPSGVNAVASMSTLGSLSDLLQACDLVVDLAERRGVERGQAARKSPCEEDFHAACPAQSDARPGPDAIGCGTTDLGQGSTNRGGRGGDRGAGRRDRQGRRTARDEAAREGGGR